MLWCQCRLKCLIIFPGNDSEFLPNLHSIRGLKFLGHGSRKQCSPNQHKLFPEAGNFAPLRFDQKSVLIFPDRYLVVLWAIVGNLFFLAYKNCARSKVSAGDKTASDSV